MVVGVRCIVLRYLSVCVLETISPGPAVGCVVLCVIICFKSKGRWTEREMGEN